MPKKKAVDAKGGQPTKSAGVGGCKRSSWPERKRRAIQKATEAGFSIERMLFFGGSLEEEVCYAVERAIRAREQLDGILLESEKTLLESISHSVADDLAATFSDGNDISGSTPDSIELALALLYLFPKLWKTADKRLSLDKLKAVDAPTLLSERRSLAPTCPSTNTTTLPTRRPRAPKQPSDADRWLCPNGDAARCRPSGLNNAGVVQSMPLDPQTVCEKLHRLGTATRKLRDDRVGGQSGEKSGRERGSSQTPQRRF